MDQEMSGMLVKQRRSRRWVLLRSFTASAALFGAVVLAGSGMARANDAPMDGATAAVQELRYEIRMEDRPIGVETVSLRQQQGQTTVTVQTETNATVLFFTFHYDHQRTELWRDGVLQSVNAHTNDDGAVSDMVAQARPPVANGPSGWTFNVNGTVSEGSEDSLPLTLWTSAVVRKDHLFSVIDAAPYAVQVAALGAEPLAIGSRTAEAQHYRLTGDVIRDLWFDADGHLLRTTFTRKGYPIEIVRLFD